MTTKTYKLGNIRQLIDLNVDKTNFHCDFEVRSLQKKPVQLTVVTQTQLDSENLEYRELDDGYLAGSVSSNEDVYQNHFLVLNAKEDTDVEVTINTREISAQEKGEEYTSQATNTKSTLPEWQQHTNFGSESTISSQESGGTNWVKIILIIVVVLIGIGLLYYFYTRNKGKSPSSIAYEPAETMDIPVMEQSSKPSLLDRLNQLPI